MYEVFIPLNAAIGRRLVLRLLRPSLSKKLCYDIFMAQGTIDLRRMPSPGHAPQRARGVRQDSMPEEVAWSALEHEDRQRGPYWFLGPGIIALALVIFGIFARSWFFVAFVCLAYAVLLAYAQRPPRRIEFRITGDGVFVGTAHHPYAELKSFWIFDAPDHKELSVETTKILTPYLRIPLGDEDPERVGRAIARFLPEEEHKEFISDAIARSLGF